MKVLWLSHLVPYPPKGGALQRSYHLLREAAKYHEVYLLAFVQNALLRNCFANLDEGREIAHAKLTQFCAEVRFVPIPCEQRWLGKNRLLIKSLFTFDPYSINWLKSNEMRQELEHIVARVPFDVVHFDTISLAPYMLCLLPLRKVLTHHNIESHMMLHRAEKERNWLKKLYLYQEGWKLQSYEKDVCPRFDVNITCSELDTKRLSEITSPPQTIEIPNGVDLDYFRPNDQTTVRNTLIFAGRLDAYPNRKAVLYIAERLWPLLKQAIPDIVIDVIGANPPKEIVQLARTDPNFHVHGFVDDVRPYLQRAAVYLCPITDGGGTKLKILDALAMEKAIVADPVACEGIDVADGTSVLFASTPKDYIANVKLLLTNKDKRVEIGKAGRLLATRKYSYATIGKELAKIFRSR